jgi:hypothetical protein
MNVSIKIVYKIVVLNKVIVQIQTQQYFHKHYANIIIKVSKIKGLE